MGMYEENLKEAGLTDNESKVYLQLLQCGEQSANEIAKNIVMDRTLTYSVLNHLIENGLVNYIIKSNKKYFKASHPENLLNSIKEKEIFVKSLVQKLKTIEKKEESKQEINIFEGKEAIRNMYYLLKEYREMVSFGATGRAYDYLYESPALAKEFIKRGLRGRLIMSIKHKSHPITLLKNMRVKYVDYESEATTTIFGEYVMIHIAKDNPLFVLIKNKDISNTYRNHFEFLWKNAKN